jgi:membrane protease YdiL (CAAX protease family)
VLGADVRPGLRARSDLRPIGLLVQYSRLLSPTLLIRRLGDRYYLWMTTDSVRSEPAAATGRTPSAISSRSQLIIFFVLAFIMAWGTWIPAFLLPHLNKKIPLIGIFAPAISALVVAAISNGTAGVLEMLGRYRRVRFRPAWYVIAILLMPAIYLAAIFIDSQVFHSFQGSIWVGSPAYFVVAAFIWLVFITSGEEIGWRGFALPRMLQTMNPKAASLVLGIIWGLWHLPMYLTPEQSSSFPFYLFLVLIVGLSFIYTAVFLKTNGSLVAAALLHAGTDIGPRILQTGHFNGTVWLTVDILVWIFAIALILVADVRRPLAEGVEPAEA